MYKTKNLKKKTKQTNNALSHLEKHSNYDLNFFIKKNSNISIFRKFWFFFSLIQASVTCTFLLFNALYFEFETCLNNIPHE